MDNWLEFRNKSISGLVKWLRLSHFRKRAIGHELKAEAVSWNKYRIHRGSPGFLYLELAFFAQKHRL